ncbi:hypothetical protein R1flu_028741 [Riccia fluitans]|uniref:CCHC-type domain-containing protein n=1 Tax=Riccia fluitans TaxID=41844 RepID=A0ABD1XRL4_9MARC
MEVQKGWGVRLTNIPQGLDVLVRIDEEKRELRVEFEERIVERKGESSRRRSGKTICHFCGRLGHKSGSCPTRWRAEGRRSTDLRLRVGPSSPLPEEDFCFTCGAKGLPKEHKCDEIASLLASVVGRLESDGTVDERDGEKIEKIASFEGTSSNQ